MKRNQKTGEKKCSSKIYIRKMLHKTPLGIVIDKILSKCSLKSTDQKNMPKTPPKFLL